MSDPKKVMEWTGHVVAAMQTLGARSFEVTTRMGKDEVHVESLWDEKVRVKVSDPSAQYDALKSSYEVPIFMFTGETEEKK